MKNKSEKGSNAIISGTLSLTISTVIVKLLGLIYKIPISNFLGDEGMGYFNSAYTVYAFFYLLCTAGVPKAVMILVSEASGAGKKLDEMRIVRVAATAFLFLGSLITLIFIIFSVPIAKFIGNSNSFATMIAIAPSIIFVSLAGVIRGYLSANLKLLDVAVSQIVEGVGKLVLGLSFAMLAIRLSLPLPIISSLTVLGVTFGAIFGFLYLWICAKIKIVGNKHRQNRKDFGIIFKRILSISIPITLSAAAMSLTNIVDLVLIMRKLIELGYDETGASALFGNYTTLAVPMFNLAIAVITPISIAFLPVFTRARVTKNSELLNNSINTSLEFTSFLCAPMMVGLLLFSKEILNLLYANSNVDIGAPLLCILCPAILFSSLLIIVNTLLESQGIVRAPVYSMLCGCIAKIISSYLLLSNPEFGIAGAPIGTVISYAVSLIISLIILSKKCSINLPILSKIFMPHINSFAAVMSAKILYLKISLTLSQSVSLLISIFVAALIYLAFSCFGGVFNIKKIREMSKYTKIA